MGKHFPRLILVKAILIFIIAIIFMPFILNIMAIKKVNFNANVYNEWMNFVFFFFFFCAIFYPSKGFNVNNYQRERAPNINNLHIQNRTG